MKDGAECLFLHSKSMNDYQILFWKIYFLFMNKNINQYPNCETVFIAHSTLEQSDRERQREPSL